MALCKKYLKTIDTYAESCDDLQEVYVYRGREFTTCEECEKYAELPECYIVYREYRGDIVQVRVFLREDNAKLYIAEENLFDPTTPYTYRIVWTKLDDYKLYKTLFNRTQKAVYIDKADNKDSEDFKFTLAIMYTILGAISTYIVMM